jgi:tRNA(adenine34) deaminase
MNAIFWMKQALLLAQEAFDHDEVPVGALIIRENECIARSRNTMKYHQNPLKHAEMNVVEVAMEVLKSTYLDNCDLYVTLEPCALCASAIAAVRIRNLYFGAYDFKTGGVDHGPRIFTYSHHKPHVFGGICEHECGLLMSEFFKYKRDLLL